MRQITTLSIVLGLSVTVAAVLNFINSISPLNGRRPLLNQTKYIVLHTTEGAAEGSLSKLRRRGEAHFMVDRDGSTHKLIDEDKVARHAGRSLWEGRPRIDEISIGIEVVGSYRLPVTTQQEAALKNLLSYLKSKHRISDGNVLTHSMVAYGVPNRYHHHDHRGRKRCGANFADPVLRKRLGLLIKPNRDLDVESGRLVVADKWLYEVLFDQKKNFNYEVQKINKDPLRNVITKQTSAWDIAREEHDNERTMYTFPNGTSFRGNQIQNWSAIPEGTKVELGKAVAIETEAEELPIKEIGKDGNTAFQIARDRYASDTTIYFLKDGRVFTGKELNAANANSLNLLPRGTKMLVGFVNGGKVSLNRSAFSITGKLWNSPMTFYRLANGQILSGDEVNPAQIPQGTFIFFER